MQEVSRSIAPRGETYHSPCIVQEVALFGQPHELPCNRENERRVVLEYSIIISYKYYYSKKKKQTLITTESELFQLSGITQV